MSGAITPMTVAATLFTLMERPMIDGSPPYRFFQMPLLMITTGAAAGRSSSGRKSRPMIGPTPITWNMLADW